MTVLRVPRFEVGDRVQRNAISAGLPYPLGTVTEVREVPYTAASAVVDVKWDGSSYDQATPAWTLQHASAIDRLGDLAR